jgi:hypothetical protein
MSEANPSNRFEAFLAIRLTSPFINAGGLSSGSYRVDIHINGEYLASGEFTVE